MSKDQPAPVTPAHADALRTVFRGPILLPDDPGFEDAAEIWNGMITRRPGLIARCQNPADVVHAVNFVRDHGLPFSARSGGHNIAGSAVADGGVMIDLSQMKYVRIDWERMTAHVAPGNKLGDIDHATQAFGLVVPSGIVSQTGLAGLTLGGGFGWLTRSYGWTSDGLVSADVVTADGRLVTCSATKHQDLFWAIRGGGGNFGIVVNFEFKVHRLGPQVAAGIVFWPIEQAPEVIEFFHEFTAGSPDEIGSLLVLRMAPPAPFLPEEVHGKPIVAIASCYNGSVEDGMRALAPIKDFGEPYADFIEPKPFIAFQSFLDPGQPNGRRYYWKAEYVDRFEPAIGHALRERLDTNPSAHSGILCFQLGGEQARYPENHSAAGHRSTQFIVNVGGSWEDAADDEANIAWVRRTWEAVHPFSGGGTYVNFLLDGDEDDRVRTGYGSNYDRLVEIKTKWDPDNLFRTNQNIRPRS